MKYNLVLFRRMEGDSVTRTLTVYIIFGVLKLSNLAPEIYLGRILYGTSLHPRLVISMQWYLDQHIFSDLQSLTFDIFRTFWHRLSHFWGGGGGGRVLEQLRNPRLWLLVYRDVMTSSSHVVYLTGNNFGRSIQSLSTVTVLNCLSL